LEAKVQILTEPNYDNQDNLIERKYSKKYVKISKNKVKRSNS